MIHEVCTKVNIYWFKNQPVEPEQIGKLFMAAMKTLLTSADSSVSTGRSVCITKNSKKGGTTWLSAYL
jgi:hypothetical protein